MSDTALESKNIILIAKRREDYFRLRRKFPDYIFRYMSTEASTEGLTSFNSRCIIASGSEKKGNYFSLLNCITLKHIEIIQESDLI